MYGCEFKVDQTYAEHYCEFIFPRLHSNAAARTRRAQPIDIRPTPLYVALPLFYIYHPHLHL
jgi:hypothetical protein